MPYCHVRSNITRGFGQASKKARYSDKKCEEDWPNVNFGLKIFIFIMVNSQNMRAVCFES